MTSIIICHHINVIQTYTIFEETLNLWYEKFRFKKCFSQFQTWISHVNSKDIVLRNVTDSNCVVVMDLMGIKVVVVKWGETTNDVFVGKQEICAVLKYTHKYFLRK